MGRPDGQAAAAGQEQIADHTVTEACENTAKPPENGGRPVPASISFVPSAAGLLLAGEIVRRLTED